MRRRLARVVEAIAEAAARRGTAPEALADLVKVLQDDHPSSAHDDDTRLTLVEQVFGLSETAADLLAVAVAPTLDPAIAHAYDLLAGRVLGGRASVGLALELAGVPTATADSSRHLQSAAPLVRGGLLGVTGDAGWLERTLTVDDRVRAHLAGDDQADARVMAVAVDVLGFHCPTSAELARALDAGQNLIWVHGPLGTAGVAVAVAAFAEAGAECLVIDARLAAAADLSEVLRAAVREAGLRAAGLVVAGAESVLAVEGLAAHVLAASPVPVIGVGTVGWPAHVLPSPPLTVAAPFLTGAERSGIWAAALGLPSGDGLDAAVARLRSSPEEILATVRYASLAAEAADEPVTASLLRDAARIVGAATASTTLTVGQVARAPGAPSSFADLVLPPWVEAELVRLVRWAEHRDEILARGSLPTKGGKGGGLAALFTGSPGTGKTLAAHVVADELGLELMQIDLSAIVDKYVGETEKHLEQVFRDAESRNVVLFFDEADALFGSRSAVQDAHDRYANQEVSYLLQRIEHFDGVTVLATNLRGNLDKAFLRRMQFIVHFPDPDAATRRRLWEQHLAAAGQADPDDPVDVERLATTAELAGGDIRNIVLAATYDAAVAGRPIGHQLVVAAATREYQKLGRREVSFA